MSTRFLGIFPPFFSLSTLIPFIVQSSLLFFAKHLLKRRFVLNMSNYYYDRSHKCYRKKRKKYDCDCHCGPRYQTYTSSPLFRNADTDFIQVSALNQTDEPQTVIIEVQNYQDTCDVDVYPSYGYLCGELINDDNGGSDDTVRNGNGGCIYCKPEGVNPFVGSVTFTIPPR